MMGDDAVRFGLSVVKDRLTAAGIQWVIFAGAAAFCYGSKRKVTDIDILVRTDDLEKAKSILNDIGGFDVGAGSEIATSEGTCRFFLDPEMIERKQWRQLFGVVVPVISVEDNIIFKAIVQRGEAEGKHDIEDIHDMAANTKIDLDYLERRIKECCAEKRVKPLLKKLGIC